MRAGVEMNCAHVRMPGAQVLVPTAALRLAQVIQVGHAHNPISFYAAK